MLSLAAACGANGREKIINGFSLPESVASDGRHFFVSNQGQDIASKDGDGFISRVSIDGNLMEQKFLPRDGVLHAPKGMAVDNNILYVADLDRLVGFDLGSRKTVLELTIPSATMLNDACRLKSGLVAVTETVSGNIYEVDVRTKSYKITGNIPTANGISYNPDTGRLAVCSSGAPLGEGAVYIKSAGGEFRKLPDIPNGFFDGIQWMDDDRLLISDWVTFPTKGFGKLWIYNLKTRQTEMLLTGEGMADIFYNRSAREIHMPQMFKNRVVITGQKELLLKNQGRYNRLYQYGVADAFAGGLYKGTLPLGDLKLKGDFGLGAPNMLDGELTFLDGKAYQTKATGETIEPENDFKTSMSFVTFLGSGTSLNIKNPTGKEALWGLMDGLLPNKNAIYAIKISGEFSHIKTRAFPPLEKEPFPAIATILDRQHFFEYSGTKGALIGFYFPEYLDGINIKGFHFHFLSTDKRQGGHVLDFAGENLKTEMAEQKSFELETSRDDAFHGFGFETRENEILRRVEHGQ